MKPSYRPAVKFRKLDKDTLTRLQVKNDSDESPNAELDDEETEGGDEEETITGTPFGADASAGCRTPFKVDPCMDLKSRALVDMISPAPDLERSAQPAQPPTPIPVETKDQMSVAEAFDSW